MEDMRDERIAYYMTRFQAQCRWYYQGVRAHLLALSHGFQILSKFGDRLRRKLTFGLETKRVTNEMILS